MSTTTTTTTKKAETQKSRILLTFFACIWCAYFEWGLVVWEDVLLYHSELSTAITIKPSAFLGAAPLIISQMEYGI